MNLVHDAFGTPNLSGAVGGGIGRSGGTGGPREAIRAVFNRSEAWNTAGTVSSNPAWELRVKSLQDETRTAGWAGEDEQAIPAGEWEWARHFVARIVRNGRLPLPFLSPCSDGSVHLAWTRGGGRRLVLEHKGSRLFVTEETAESVASREVSEPIAVGKIAAFFVG